MYREEHLQTTTLRDRDPPAMGVGGTEGKMATGRAPSWVATESGAASGRSDASHVPVFNGRRRRPGSTSPPPLGRPQQHDGDIDPGISIRFMRNSARAGYCLIRMTKDALRYRTLCPLEAEDIISSVSVNGVILIPYLERAKHSIFFPLPLEVSFLSDCRGHLLCLL